MAISAYDNINYAQYSPISMQEMWAPAAMLREQHDKLQEDYSNAEQAAQQGFSGLNPEVDKEALSIHKQFMDQTKAAADELATKGFIDSGRRRSLLKLKSVYTNQVAPLQQQIALRASRNEELRKMQLQDPTFRATANPNQVSLVSGLKNPNAFDYDGVSGNQLYSSVAKKAEQLSKVISQEHPELIHSKIFANYFTALQSGASLDQIDKAMKSGGKYNPQDVDKMTQMLHGIVGSTMNEFGVPSKFAGNEAVQQDLWNAAAQGLYSAAGTKQFGQMQDDMALYNRKKALEKPLKDPVLPKIPVSLNPNMESEDEFKRLNHLYNASLGKNYEVISSGAQSITGGGQLLAKPNGVASKSDAQQEIYNMARSLGIQIPSWSKTGKAPTKEWESFANTVIKKQKSRLKSATPIFTIATGDDNVSKSIYQAIQSGAVVLPSDGKDELNADKYNELKKSYGNPIITLSPAGVGVEIKFGNGKSYKADNSIFQNQRTSKTVDSVMEFTKKFRPLILDPIKNIDIQPNVRKVGNDYLMDLSEYGKGVIQFPKKFVSNGGLSKYLSELSSEVSGNTLNEVFSNVGAQNQGFDIKF